MEKISDFFTSYFKKFSNNTLSEKETLASLLSKFQLDFESKERNDVTTLVFKLIFNKKCLRFFFHAKILSSSEKNSFHH
eukprot:UN24681